MGSYASTADSTPKSSTDQRRNVRVSTAFKTKLTQNLQNQEKDDVQLLRKKLNEIESFKFFLFIAMNIELVEKQAFSKPNCDKKGSVLKGFYKVMQSFLQKSKPEHYKERACAVLRGHFHRLMPDVSTYKDFQKNAENYYERP